MKEILSIADKAKGVLVDLGFGKGTSLKSIIELMNKGEIVKRDIYIYESFNGYPAPTSEDQSSFQKGGFKRPPQPAYDIVHSIKKEVTLHKGFVEDTLKSYNETPIGIIYCDLGPYKSTKYILEKLYKYLSVNGIVYFAGYDRFPGTKLAVDNFVTEKKLQNFLSVEDGYAYIRKAPVKNLKGDKVTRTRSILT